ncbi:uncharacterized protein CCR75_000626 [Bremia lactucae]|uniref:glucan endo-1,3-beta-D-glucosidase n=1 Tax=Bremia lactucae TaxID=4779 RepID=A0A976FDP4_BRELC|nr:hypothetical protein CCR75_000626 [Bremia lactucae]
MTMRNLLPVVLFATILHQVTAFDSIPDIGGILQSTLSNVTDKLIGTTKEASFQSFFDYNGEYFAPFGTDEPSKELYVQNDSLKDIVPIINVAPEALKVAIPTNDWWTNLIHVTDSMDVSNYAAWANPYAVKLPREAPYGLQTFYSFSYREFGDEVNGTVRYYNHSFHNDLTLSSKEFFSCQPVYEIFEWDEGGAKVLLGGTVSMESRTSYTFHWDVEGSSCDTSGLLHFALHHQIESMGGPVIDTTSYGAIILHSATRGQMVAQVTTTPMWSFVEPEADFEVDFYPPDRPSPWLVKKIDLRNTLEEDILGNWSTWDVDSWYFNGKSFQKYASLCLMASDVSVVGRDTSLLSFCLDKLESLIEPLLNNTLTPFLMYDTLYRGLISTSIFRANNIYEEFGNSIYNDHHYHYGYFVVASAILKHLDPNWYRMPELEELIWTMLRDVANPSKKDPYYPCFRHFSWYLGHSYSHGVTSIDNGKDEESTSEDINFFYGMTLWGRVTGRKAVEDLGSLMLRLDAHAIRTYFLLKRDNTIHPPEIVRNHVTGIFFDNLVLYNTWFLDEIYAIHGIQMIPVSPINRLARTSTFVAQEWNDILAKQPIIVIENSNISWLSLLLVNGATVDPMESLRRLPNATMDDGLSLSWALYNAATRCRDGVKVNMAAEITLTIDKNSVISIHTE